MTELHVTAIPADRLTALRSRDADDLGNRIEPIVAEGDEPLRCCLRHAEPGEAIALISYAPFATRSPWTEVGPVFVHADECAGYPATDALPDELRTGPRVLRTYSADGSLDYDDITLAPAGADLEPLLRELLERPQVTRVHVRSVLPQCFHYEVRAQA
jgi:hypothetical protein